MDLVARWKDTVEAADAARADITASGGVTRLRLALLDEHAAFARLWAAHAPAMIGALRDAIGADGAQSVLLAYDLQEGAVTLHSDDAEKLTCATKLITSWVADDRILIASRAGLLRDATASSAGIQWTNPANA